jgi:hypothetical protein
VVAVARNTFSQVQEERAAAVVVAGLVALAAAGEASPDKATQAVLAIAPQGPAVAAVALEPQAVLLRQP